jgi:hypothetical protein
MERGFILKVHPEGNKRGEVFFVSALWGRLKRN